MAAGVPVAASRVPSIVQHQAAGEPIALFDPDHPASIAACVGALLGDEPRRIEMAREGLRAAGKRSFDNRADLVTAFVEHAGGRVAARAAGHVG
jgi:glycosyltransferase involved in cell wall biosynthesis